MMLESRLESAFVLHVRKDLGGMTVKLAPVAAGMPDRLVLLPGGQIHLVELKAPAGRLRAAQTHWQGRAAELGVTVHVLTGLAQMLAWDPREEPTS